MVMIFKLHLNYITCLNYVTLDDKTPHKCDMSLTQWMLMAPPRSYPYLRGSTHLCLGKMRNYSLLLTRQEVSEVYPLV